MTERVALVTAGGTGIGLATAKALVQSSPNRKSNRGMTWKNRIASNSTDRTMPSVVSTAINELPNNSQVRIFSTWLRARNSGVTRRIASAAPRMATRMTSVALICAALAARLR